jgi:putative endonuclease
MSRRRQLTGQRGEDLAAAFLQRRGYDLVVRNWRCRAGEIDIVARQGDTLVFVEVRTRRGPTWGTPEESITAPKKARLIELAQTYLQELAAVEQLWRIDVIAILLGTQGHAAHINHIESAVGE